jgi:hypothetical protein
MNPEMPEVIDGAFGVAATVDEDRGEAVPGTGVRASPGEPRRKM